MAQGQDAIGPAIRCFVDEVRDPGVIAPNTTTPLRGRSGPAVPRAQLDVELFEPAQDALHHWVRVPR